MTARAVGERTGDRGDRTASPRRARGPIFIGGLSRSGKTQLRIVLGAHPEVSMTRRTYLWDRYYGRFGDLGEPGNLESCLRTLLRDARIRSLEPDARRIRKAFLEGPRTYAALFGLLHEQHAARVGMRRWGEQLGLVERFADPIFETFASARMIHMVRDPRARYVAVRRAGSRLPAALGWHTAQWSHSAELARRNQARHPEGYLVVPYESFAARPAETLREVCSFLGEDVVPSMLEAVKTLRFDGVPHGVTTEDDDEGLGRPDDVRFVERYAREGLLAHGYALSGARPTSWRRLAFALTALPINRASMAAWTAVRSRPLAGAGG